MHGTSIMRSAMAGHTARSMVGAFLITLFFVGGTTMQEGPASTWAYIQPGLLGVLYGAAIYLNLLWITRLIPRRRYTIGLWRWRIVLEPQ